MKNFSIIKSRRLRSTPYTDRIEAHGVSGYTVYNHMLLPVSFKSVEADYEHLKKFVQVWDVAAERQVQITGCLLYTSPSPRDATLSRMPSSA